MPAAQWQSGPASAGTKQNWLLTEIDLLQIWNKERILEILHLLRKLTLCPPRCESHLLISVSILILLRFQEVWRNKILPNTPPQSIYEMSAIYNNITAFIILCAYSIILKICSSIEFSELQQLPWDSRVPAGEGDWKKVLEETVCVPAQIWPLLLHQGDFKGKVLKYFISSCSKYVHSELGLNF